MINNRELALLIWLLIVLAVFLLNSDLRAILYQLAKVLVQPVILIPVLVMGGWVAGLVAGAQAVGWWGVDLAIDTAIWFFGTAFVLMMSANEALRRDGLFGNAVGKALRVTVFVEVFVNLYVFPLWTELAILPVATVLSMLSVVAGSRGRLQGFKSIFDILLVLVGLALLAYVLFELIGNWQGLDTGAVSAKFALPVWLTIGVLPFVYLLSLFMAYDSAFRQIDAETHQSIQRWRAKIALVWRLRLSVHDIASFRFYWAKQVVAAASLADAVRVVDEFKTSRDLKAQVGSGC